MLTVLLERGRQIGNEFAQKSAREVGGPIDGASVSSKGSSSSRRELERKRRFKSGGQLS